MRDGFKKAFGVTMGIYAGLMIANFLSGIVNTVSESGSNETSEKEEYDPDKRV